ncbi:MAG: hypothetical protein ACJA2Z_000213 [Candidatus Paceibacteria bacterium]
MTEYDSREEIFPLGLKTGTSGYKKYPSELIREAIRCSMILTSTSRLLFSLARTRNKYLSVFDGRKACHRYPKVKTSQLPRVSITIPKS